MLICPQCKAENPQHHKFCQICGRALGHHICARCGADVDFDRCNCPECQAEIGTYWWAIITPSRLKKRDAISKAERQQKTATAETPERMSEENLQAVSSNLNGKSAPATTETITREVDGEQKHGESRVALLPNPESNLDRPEVPPASGDNLPSLTVTTHLDGDRRYQLLDPVALQLLSPTDSIQVRTIDLQPFVPTDLEMLLEEEPVTIGSTMPGQLPENYRLWQVWNEHGIPRSARAYMALRVGLHATIPAIHDSWDRDGKVVILVEDRTHWSLLVEQLSDPALAPSQVIYWLDYTLKLWVLLAPWKMRHSLLELSNLLLDEDGTICFQRLYSEQSGRELSLADLAKVWKILLHQSNAEPSTALIELIRAIEHQEIGRIEEVRSQLQQIAYELEPKPPTQPINILSGELSQPHDGTTIALAKRLVALDEAAATHTGKKRDHNEDCFGIVTRTDRNYSPKGQSISARGLYIMCDGMGGHDSGEVASAMTVELLQDYFATHWQDTMPDEATIREGIISTNQAIFEINQQNSASGSGRMGTTLVLLLIQDQTIAVAHVGDSRCYAITPSQGLIQLTLDHEVGQQQILRGVEPDIAYGRPDSYQLTQAIGPRDRNYIAPDINFYELQEDTLLILASDGLTDNQLLETHWLTNVAPLLSTSANLQQGVERLIDFANEYNGHDNITALLVRAKLQA